MTQILPGDCTLQCGMWLLNHDSEFTKWQHPAMWYVALGWHAIEFAHWHHPAMWHVALESRHWIRQVAAPCNVADGSGTTCHKIRQNVHHTSGFDFDHITAINMSFCTSLQNFIQIRQPSAEKMTSCRFSRWRISAILDFRGPITGSLKSPCTTSYRSKLLSFWENRLFVFWWQTDRQTDEQMDNTNALSCSRYRELRLNK